MATKLNPFRDITKILARIQQFSETDNTPEVARPDVIKYSGKFHDYYGEPITIEILYDSDSDMGNATITRGNQSFGIKFKSGGGGVMNYKIVNGSEIDLVETLLALASDRQEM